MDKILAIPGSPPVAITDLSEVKPVSNPEDFESMVTDLRKTYSTWLKKTSNDVNIEQESINKDRVAFEQKKVQMWNQLQADYQLEMDKLKEERRKAEIELQTALKQIQIERDDAQRKLEEEAEKLDEECELHRRKLLLEREKFRQEVEQYEEEKDKVNQSNISTDTRIELNVGGVIFESSRHVLTQQPGSVLEGVLTGRLSCPRDRQGRLFLDRDTHAFRTCLNFLRRPTIPPTPKDALESDTLCREADSLGLRFFPFPLVFALGGHDGTEPLTSVELLDVEQQSWRPVTPLVTPRANFGAATPQGSGKLFVFGGSNLDYKALCDVEAYDVLRDTWMQAASMNNPRRNLSACAIQERLFAIGGFDGAQILNSVEAYDPRMKSWIDLPALHTPRSSALTTASADGNYIYVMGGTKGERLRSVEVYDVRANKWIYEHVPGMIETRSAGAAVVCNGGKLFAIGGTDAAQNVHSSVETFDPATIISGLHGIGGSAYGITSAATQGSLWSFVRSMGVERMDLAAVTIGSMMGAGGARMGGEAVLVSGGQCGDVLSSCEFYRPEVDEWQLGPDMKVPRYAHQLLLANI